MTPDKLGTLRSLLLEAFSVDRERTRLTRETLLSLVQSMSDEKMAVTFLADFTRAHDALEVAIAEELPEEDIAARRLGCIALLERLATRH